MGVVLAGLGSAPNTKSIGKRSSGPMVLFTAYSAILRHSASVTSFLSMDFLIFEYDACNCAWFLSTIPMDPGVSIGASSITIPWEAAFCLNSSDMYPERWSTAK